MMHLSRVDRFLPILQVEVCFLRLPPGFPAVPHYFNHLSVGPGPSQNRTCGFPASGSSSRFTACLLIVDLVSVTMLLPGLCVPHCFSASIHLPVNPFPPPALPGFISTMGRSDYLYLVLKPRSLGSKYPLTGGRHRSSQVPGKSLEQHAVDYDPGGVSTLSPLTMASLLPSGFLIPWARSTT